MTQSRLVTRALLPIAVVLNVTPLIAIAPALVVAFSSQPDADHHPGRPHHVFPGPHQQPGRVALGDPLALEVLETLHASRWETLWRLQLPSSLPYLFAAARVVVPLASWGPRWPRWSRPGYRGASAC